MDFGEVREEMRELVTYATQEVEFTQEQRRTNNHKDFENVDEIKAESASL